MPSSSKYLLVEALLLAACAPQKPGADYLQRVTKAAFQDTLSRK